MIGQQDHNEGEAQHEQSNEFEPAGLVPTETDRPAPPKGMRGEDAQLIEQQAAELVGQLGEATGGKELAYLDNVTHVGVQEQRNAAEHLNLLKARMADFLSAGGTSRDIANGLRDLRMTLDQINPHEAAGKGLLGRIARRIPLIGSRHNPVARALNRIAVKYEPVTRQITVIETRLREGRAMLARDNVDLRKVYEGVEAQQQPLQRNIYLGEVLMLHLNKLAKQTDDPMKHDRIQGALLDVTTRVQDLRTMEEVNVQFFVSIEMSRQNNNRLGQSVEQTLTLTTNVVTVGLAIQSALVRQTRVMEAAQRTRQFLGDLVTANAAAIRQHTTEIGDLQKQPVIALEKIVQAHDDLVEALNIASRLQDESITAATENITTLRQMSAKLAERVGGLHHEEAGVQQVPRDSHGNAYVEVHERSDA